MIDKKEFSEIKSLMEKDEETREEIISSSRDMIRLSKKLIYSLHRKDMDAAKKMRSEIGKQILQIREIAEKCPKFSYSGIYSVAVQEYVEALTYYEFMFNKRIPGYKELGVEYEEYLLGLCDLTGELERRAVHSTVAGEYKDVLLIKEVVEEIYDEFLMFDLRNSELRKKSDSIKWNLKKIEEILYDLKLKDKI